MKIEIHLMNNKEKPLTLDISESVYLNLIDWFKTSNAEEVYELTIIDDSYGTRYETKYFLTKKSIAYIENTTYL